MTRDDRITKGFSLDVALHQLSAEIIAIQLSGGDANKMLIRWSTLLEEAKASITNENSERLKEYMLQRKEPLIQRKEIPIEENLINHIFAVQFDGDYNVYNKRLHEICPTNIKNVVYFGDK